MPDPAPFATDSRPDPSSGRSSDSSPGSRSPRPAEFKLDKLPALQWVLRLWSVLAAVLLALLLSVPWLIGLRRPWDGSTLLMLALLLPLLLLAGLLGWLYASRYFAAYQARCLPEEGVVLKQGVWWRSEIWVPMARLQHLDVSQGPLDRRWGMASLSLHTAGTHDHKIRIHGLPVAQAHALREALMPRLRGAPDHG